MTRSPAPAHLMTSLADLISSGDFSGRHVDVSDWILDAEDIERLLYDRVPHDYVAMDLQINAFQAGEELSTVDINTWICTDTKVGLQLLCLNLTPIALIWQPARKSDREIAFLSEEAADLLATAWEKYRIKDRPSRPMVDPAILGMPIAPAGAVPYDIETGAQLSNLGLSDEGIAEFLDALASHGGLAAVTSPEMIASLLKMAEANHAIALRSIRETDEVLARTTVMNRDYFLQCRKDQVRWAEAIEETLIAPLSDRLADLKEQLLA